MPSLLTSPSVYGLSLALSSVHTPHCSAAYSSGSHGGECCWCTFQDTRCRHTDPARCPCIDMHRKVNFHTCALYVGLIILWGWRDEWTWDQLTIDQPNDLRLLHCQSHFHFLLYPNKFNALWFFKVYIVYKTCSVLTICSMELVYLLPWCSNFMSVQETKINWHFGFSIILTNMPNDVHTLVLFG